ncbi:MAG: SAM-dependent chlorinase/fluorinase [Elusimicrobia bacterium]|nr:SAM-dependent chlorinase/fluorinase [Elusimicrobiota bacterium]
MSLLIAFLTDFGQADPFVGVMKGVILSRYFQARMVDVTHHVPPQDVRTGAFYLMSAAPYFPEDTLFICIVDPGVGSERRILWARTASHQFLAPDNGLLSWLDHRQRLQEVREVTNRRLFLDRVSTTFHGRDVFAPVAAELARGLPPADLGARIHQIKRLPFPEPRRYAGRILGAVLSVDRFGNAITNIPVSTVPARAVFYFKDKNLGPLKLHYTAVPSGRPLAVAGSSGFAELSVRNGSFVETYGLTPGDPVEAKFR